MLASIPQPSRPRESPGRGRAGWRLPPAGWVCQHGTKATPRWKVAPVTARQPAIAMADINLSDTGFWGWPLAARRAAFATLRAAPQPQFYAEPESPFGD